MGIRTLHSGSFAVGAAADENSGVRNNAIRSIGCIAGVSKEMAALIPADDFIQMLNSGIWTDRNKGEFVVLLSKNMTLMTFTTHM
jgi:hypothetical protein